MSNQIIASEVSAVPVYAATPCARSVTVRLIALLVLSNLTALSSDAALTHSYTFNNGSAADPIGNANGTLLGGASIDVNGVLQLSGGATSYVNLPGAGLGISSYTDVSFEAWFSFRQVQTWQRVFDIGDRNVALPGYIYYTPNNASNVGLGVYTSQNVRVDAPHSALTTNHFYHLAMVVDDDANGGADQIRIYLDGALQTTVGHSAALANLPSTFAYLGKSLVADPNLNGSIDEFRIYNHALSAAEVTSNFVAGPTPPTTIRLEVNTVTGSAAMVGPAVESQTFDYYTITSAGGQLSTSGWSSFDSQNVDAIGAGTGESWDIEPPSDSHELTEFFLDGTSTITPNERMSLGHAYNPLVEGRGVDGDLVFRFGPQGSQQLKGGTIAYITPPLSAGDYNEDGTVNAADYTIWRNTLGSTSDLRADGDGNLRIDQDDYVVWKWSYGHVGPGSGAAVPEPATAMTTLLALLGVVSAVRRLRR